MPIVIAALLMSFLADPTTNPSPLPPLVLKPGAPEWVVACVAELEAKRQEEFKNWQTSLAEARAKLALMQAGRVVGNSVRDAEERTNAAGKPFWVFSSQAMKAQYIKHAQNQVREAEGFLEKIRTGFETLPIPVPNSRTLRIGLLASIDEARVWRVLDEKKVVIETLNKREPVRLLLSEFPTAGLHNDKTVAVGMVYVIGPGGGEAGFECRSFDPAEWLER